ncbi:hypothetical protein CLV63_12180 [Murinocardiopsis flavida]|uniref:CDP-glycerol:poly(Glycerophosphate) glycerophosphotransferase n=2 Tax=Murinocardiopsis flavida TaxID=645275 RepID=A0A2P8D154_9ACTN|nr:hypothetical protein CLV63_12180 [Murinocardiopsis flavida]
MSEYGFLCLSWEQAMSIDFDLVIAASLGDNLHEIKSPILRLAHGNGYNKYSNREPGAGSREPGAGSREPGAGSREPGAFGLTEDTLKYGDRVVPSAIGLSHFEQLDRLAEGCPDALPRAFIAGDPCYDRLIASLPRRLNYRHAFGLHPGQRLITVNSTWKYDSLFGIDPMLIPRLLEQLPYDGFRIALILHPNIWASHSRLQIESWLFDARRAGLLLIPPNEGWRAAVIAADWVVSDHGSVSMYAAALGRPVLLEKSAWSAIDPRSGLGRLFDVAPTLDPLAPITPQLRLADDLRAQTHALAETWVSSAPGHALALIRNAAYRLMGTPAPTAEPVLLALPDPEIGAAIPSALWMHVEQTNGGGGPSDLDVRRTPAAVANKAPIPAHGAEGVLIVSDGELDHRLSSMADIVGIARSALPADEVTWSHSIFEHRFGVRLTVVHDSGSAKVRSREGRVASIALESITHPGDAELVFAVLAERALGDESALEDVAALRQLRLNVSPDRTIAAEFRTTLGPTG